eukprot:UN00292
MECLTFFLKLEHQNRNKLMKIMYNGQTLLTFIVRQMQKDKIIPLLKLFLTYIPNEDMGWTITTEKSNKNTFHTLAQRDKISDCYEIIKYLMTNIDQKASKF